jgi:hypothetical protein
MNKVVPRTAALMGSAQRGFIGNGLLSNFAVAMVLELAERLGRRGQRRVFDRAW